MSHLEDVEKALGVASAVLAAVQFCATHYGFGGFEFSFEDLPAMTIDQTLERTLAFIKPVNQAIEQRRPQSPGSSGKGAAPGGRSSGRG